MNKLPPFLLTLFLVSCASEIISKQEYKNYMDSLLGLTKEDLIVELGIPSKQQKLENDVSILEWVPMLHEPLYSCREVIYVDPNNKVYKWERRNCKDLDKYNHTPTAHEMRIREHKEPSSRGQREDGAN
jgi:hypothetical protein